jgi:hypothetical protein
MLDTLPLALIATVPAPLKLTQALHIYSGAVPEIVGTWAESIFGVVSVLFVSVSVVLVPTNVVLASGILRVLFVLVLGAAKVSVPVPLALP